MTMGQRTLWRLCMVLSFCSSTIAMDCKWLQLHQERLSKMILLSFKELGQGEQFPLQCITSELFPPNINFIYNSAQVQTAMLTIQEVMLQINRFYGKIHCLFGYDRKKMDIFQTLLQYKTGYLIDCNSNIKENLHWEMKKAIHEYFKKLEEIAYRKSQLLHSADKDPKYFLEY